jgi:hypothetical protein
MTNDTKAIEELATVSDIKKPHNLEHYLYFPSEEDAKHVAELLSDQGFMVECELGADQIDWLVLAKHQIVPTIESMAEFRALLDGIARKHAGEYDGWEAEVRRE